MTIQVKVDKYVVIEVVEEGMLLSGVTAYDR